MSDASEIYAKLSARFPTEDHRKVNKGGSEQTYVPAEKVIERLNTALGMTGWSFSVLREGFTDSEAWVLGEITADVGGVVIKRQQYGNEPIVMGRAERPTSDLLKKACTDSLKKAATLLGVAAYLYDEDERREVEAEMREAARPKPPARQRPAPTQLDATRAAAMVTGGSPEPAHARWARLVDEAEAAGLPTWRQARAVDVTALSEAQLTRYADQLAAKLAEAMEATG